MSVNTQYRQRRPHLHAAPLLLYAAPLLLHAAPLLLHAAPAPLLLRAAPLLLHTTPLLLSAPASLPPDSTKRMMPELVALTSAPTRRRGDR
jgi:hypothetical protein